MSDPIRLRRVEGHDAIFERFQRSLTRNRLGSAYLFVGPEGIGKRTFAQYLAASLLCEQSSAEELSACERCAACQQVAAMTHPDYEYLNKPTGKSTIPVELLIGDKQHRMREGLCARIAMTPARGARKVAVIDDADFLSQESANCMLKTLEEPPLGSLLILIGTSAQRQLPTIRSRCQVVTFGPLRLELTERLIREQGLADTPADAARLAHACRGSLASARLLQSPDIWQFQHDLQQTLSGIDWRPLLFVKLIHEFVEAAGKEASAKRERLSMAADMAADHFRAALHEYVESTALGTEGSAHAAQLAGCWPHELEALIVCAERCLAARQQVATNANQATLIEAWVDFLWGIFQHGLDASMQETVTLVGDH